MNVIHILRNFLTLSWQSECVFHLKWILAWIVTAQEFGSPFWSRGPGDFCLNKRATFPTGTGFHDCIKVEEKALWGKSKWTVSQTLYCYLVLICTEEGCCFRQRESWAKHLRALQTPFISPVRHWRPNKSLRIDLLGSGQASSSSASLGRGSSPLWWTGWGVKDDNQSTHSTGVLDARDQHVCHCWPWSWLLSFPGPWFPHI